MEAASHSYLGGQLESIPYSLKHEVEDGRRFDIIMIGLNDVVLFPYETIALRISNETNTDINTILSQHANISSDLIGIVNISQSHVYADIGTLVSVKSKGATTPQSSTVPGDWAITAYGHGRFHVEHTWHWQSLHLATVVVLAEDFGCPVGYSRGSEVFGNYISIRSSSDKSRRGTTGVEHAFPAWIAEARSPFCLARRVWVSLLNSFSPCGMDMTEKLVYDWGPADSKLKMWEVGEDGWLRACMDPVGFSYQVAANLPLSDDSRLKLLRAENCAVRLRLLLELINIDVRDIYGCAVCKMPLLETQDIFHVPGSEGVVGAYVNANGHVHQMVTVRRLVYNHATAVILQGKPTATDSWFPGYSWTIAHCAHCARHIGWHFTHDSRGTRDTFTTEVPINDNLRWFAPREQRRKRIKTDDGRVAMFWGFKRGAIVNVTGVQEVDDEEDEFVDDDDDDDDEDEDDDDGIDNDFNDINGTEEDDDEEEEEDEEEDEDDVAEESDIGDVMSDGHDENFLASSGDDDNNNNDDHSALHEN